MARKTIKMPKELLAKWLAALRSGKYTQGKMAMVDPRGGHCCLAVLVAAAGDDPTASIHENTLPSVNWLKRHDVEFAMTEYGKRSAMFRNPFLPTLNCTASTANDREGHTFAQIADAVEACAVGV